MKFGLGMLAALLAGTTAAAQTGGRVLTSPEAILAKTMAARSGYQGAYQLQCTVGGTPNPILKDWGRPPPTKLFDNLFYVGINNVGAFALKTSAGIILIDSLNNPIDAETIIVPGMKAMGLDPADIKFVLLTHGHGDHFGGAQWIRDTYGARIVASEVDWGTMSRPPRKGPDGQVITNRGPAPARDLVAVDGQKINLGDTTVTMVLTPGHTPGTMSLVIPVKDRGVPHMLAMWGGTGFPEDAASRQQYIASFAHFALFTKEAKVDVELSNHPFADGSLERMEWLRSHPNDANPFVIGESRYADYMGILENCNRARMTDAGASAR